MDGFETNEELIVMSALERPDVLEPRAAARTGRFDKHIVVDRPGLKEPAGDPGDPHRKKKLARGVDLERIAGGRSA